MAGKPLLYAHGKVCVGDEAHIVTHNSQGRYDVSIEIKHGSKPIVRAMQVEGFDKPYVIINKKKVYVKDLIFDGVKIEAYPLW